MPANRIPRFSFELTHYLYPNFGCIEAVVDGIHHLLHRIKNVDEFYQALGYTEHMRRCRLTPDEFIWFEYYKDNAAKSEACLQAATIEYLHQHSEIFRVKYGSQYAQWAGSCSSEKIRKTPDCTGCRMNPDNREIEHNYLTHIAELAAQKIRPLTPAQARFNILKKHHP